MTTERTTCVVVGGGPAGMVLGLLLARAGVEVQVLEKHQDFLRDFRGDTVHPSTLELLDELGLADRFAALPYSRVDKVEFPAGEDRTVVVADFRRLRVRHPYVAMVPQWDLLDLLADAAAQEPAFTLRMSTNRPSTSAAGGGGQTAGGLGLVDQVEGQGRDENACTERHHRGHDALRDLDQPGDERTDDQRATGGQTPQTRLYPYRQLTTFRPSSSGAGP